MAAAVGAATVGAFGVMAGTTFLMRVAPYAAPVAGAGKAVADNRTLLPEGQAISSIVRDGRIVSQTADIMISHERLVEKTFGAGGMPVGTWVGRVGKLGGEITALNSKTVMGNQLPAPTTIQDLFRSVFK
jgi:hypothetical protein